MQGELFDVLALLRAREGVELVGMRADALEALVAARCRARGASIGAYLEILRHDATERSELVAGARVAVTSLFRDPEVFEALARVLSGAPPRPPIRAWSIGTATGEEAWSLACVLEALGLDFTVLGTDVDPDAVAHARRGRFRADADIPPLHRPCFVPAGDDEVAIVDALRPRVRFAVHDLLGPALAPVDAVIASFDVVLLRNVLVHFAPDAVHLALERVTRVLEPGGLLVLGQTESVPVSFAWAFASLGSEARIYRRRQGRR